MVLIKCMECPDTCADCELFVQLYGEDVTQCIFPEGRGDYCPLDEVVPYGPEGTLYKEK